MTVTDGDGERGIVRAVFGDGRIDLVTIGRVPEITGGFWPGHGTIPDLDDDLTRLGVLAVVRRACGHLACVESPAVSGLLRLSTDHAPWRVHFRGGIAIGDTEEEALLFALESES